MINEDNYGFLVNPYPSGVKTLLKPYIKDKVDRQKVARVYETLNKMYKGDLQRMREAVLKARAHR